MLRPRSPQDSFYGSYLYDRIVPHAYLLRKIDQMVDYSFIHELVKDRYTLAFGRPAEAPEFMLSAVLPDQKFTGQRLDAGTGLYYYGARYYDATIGRFISADTLVQSPANPQTLNRYSYVLNNPLRYVDPSGHIVTIMNYFITGTVIHPDGSISCTYAHDDTLIQAWRNFKNACPAMAEFLVEAKEEYVVTFGELGPQTGGKYQDDTQYIIVDNQYKGDVVNSSITVTHEAAHAIAGMGDNSIFEETVAYQMSFYMADYLDVGLDFPRLNTDTAEGLSLWPILDTTGLGQVKTDWQGTIYRNLDPFAPGDVYGRLLYNVILTTLIPVDLLVPWVFP